MAKKIFKVRFSVEATVAIEEDLIEEVLKPDWQKTFYHLTVPDEVAEHLAYNFIHNRARLTSLDGFAHRKEEDAELMNEEWETVQGS